LHEIIYSYIHSDSVETDFQTALLSALRRASGHATSAQMQATLGVSQPTVSRALRPLLASGAVIRVGAARAQRYVLPRSVEGLGARIPVIEIQPSGEPRPFGTLIPLAGDGFWMEEDHGRSAFHESLPWFLYDMRPQGFLGRGFAQAHPDLNLPGNLQHWSDDHILKALVNAGDDPPGNLIVGAAAFDRYMARAGAPGREVDNPETTYPQLALAALGSSLGASSAGGEQPKFSAARRGRAVLVKFSPAGDSPADQRWRDLLICEALALQTLSEAGIAAAPTEIVQAGGRVFLQSQRFDRTAQGRVGMVSLDVYDRQYIGQGTNWVDTAQRIDRAGAERLSVADVTTLCLLDAFGALIANTDRHHGNISLLLHNDRWQLAPAYDMLPMLYAPVAGEIVPRDFAAQPPRPSVHTLEVWPRARELALRFWQAAASDTRISGEFRELAQANERLLAGL
jgi:hypothetical protein